MRVKITVDELKVMSMYNEGYSQEAIAKTLHVARSVVRRVLKSNNAQNRPQKINSIEEFWSKVNKEKSELGCWLWTGSVNNHGYGQFPYSGQVFLAHRLAYQLLKGRIPDGMHLCHKCDNPMCCNPDHITVGTAQFNSIDCILKNRHPNIKLNADKVKTIRELYSSGTSYKTLMEMFQVSKSTVFGIVTNKRWQYVH